MDGRDTSAGDDGPALADAARTESSGGTQASYDAKTKAWYADDREQKIMTAYPQEVQSSNFSLRWLRAS